ncbi:MAG: LTA synthase family protein [Bacilli bacterium]|nr:LTA synthase family protein [Bacilli bacterium]
MKKIKFKKVSDLIIDFSKSYPVLLFYIVSNFINSILLRLFTTGSFQIRALFFDLGFVILFTAFSFLIKKNKKKTYYVITSILMVAICVINSIYYNYYSSFVSVSLLATSVFVQDFGDVIVEFALDFKDWIYIWQLIGLILIIIKYSDREKNVKRSFTKVTILSIILVGIGSAMPPYNSWSRFIKLWNRVAVVNSFGVYTYQVDDLFQSLKPTLNNMFGYDNALKKVTEYYDENRKEQSINKYTGIFEGKNVIAIHAESLQTFAIGLTFNGEEVTPNINKLIKESLYFDNFYAQVGVGTSSDSEFTYATSLLPANSGTVFVNYFDNKFVTMQNLLNNKGYYVFSMHGNVGDFWNRDVMHQNMGYDKYFSKSSFVIDEEYGLGLSDESFFSQVVPMIKDIEDNIGEPYYGTLITLTNHTPWDDADEYSDLNLTKTIEIDGEMVTRDYLEGKVLGRYIKSINYMDQAIGNFLEDMEENGLLDDTVIVIYGDHDARISKGNYDYMYNYDPVTDSVLKPGDEWYTEFNDYDYELSKKVPLIIWSSDMEEVKTISVPMGMIDVMPTLGNMLNVYNKYALGKDIMNITDNENVVVFKDGSYVTSKIYYSARNNEAYAISNGIISEDYISINSEYANTILDISNDVIIYDLLKELK